MLNVYVWVDYLDILEGPSLSPFWRAQQWPSQHPTFHPVQNHRTLSMQYLKWNVNICTIFCFKGTKIRWICAVPKLVCIETLRVMYYATKYDSISLVSVLSWLNLKPPLWNGPLMQKLTFNNVPWIFCNKDLGIFSFFYSQYKNIACMCIENIDDFLPMGQSSWIKI